MKTVRWWVMVLVGFLVVAVIIVVYILLSKSNNSTLSSNRDLLMSLRDSAGLNGTDKFILVSEIPGKTVILDSQSALEAIVNEKSLFSEGGVRVVGTDGNVGPGTISKIRIVLSASHKNPLFTWIGQNSDGNPTGSRSIQIQTTGDMLEFRIWVSPDDLSSANSKAPLSIIEQFIVGMDVASGNYMKLGSRHTINTALSDINTVVDELAHNNEYPLLYVQ